MRTLLLVLPLVAVLTPFTSAADAAPTSPPTASAVTATDVAAGHPARQAVRVLMERGLLSGYPEGTFRGERPLTRYQAAMILHRALSSGDLKDATLTAWETGVVVAGLREVVDELVRVSGRVDAAARRVTEQEGRLRGLEEQVRALLARDGVTATTAPAFTAERIDALEDAVTALAALLSVRSTREVASTAGKQDGSGSRPPSPAFPPARPAPEVQEATPPRARASFVGVAVTPPPPGQTGVGVVRVEATFGVRNVLAGFGARFGLGFTSGVGALTLEAVLARDLDVAGITPSLGLGAGVMWSASRSITASSAADVYVSGLLGVDYPLNDALALTGEFGARYFLSNRGQGTDLQADASRGVVSGARLGVEFRF
ncbi:S-layer homology domain-containing protein [Deinococcus pimensis]|uniref:S-layer homology domain-containing protein n=1 Tax=Deinococcus pimensis TaxID=309888 RepID=UPI0004852973|nr:S-layer homology domain-containing protein [Deinococcus pimensis]